MDSSRKRKANNATPSNTDGSATKKIKLVVRVPLPLRSFAERIAFLDRVQANGAWVCLCVSDGGAGLCCEREDRSRRFASVRVRAWTGIGL